MVLVAVGGQAIEKWVSSSGVRGVMYDRMASILTAARVQRADLFFWHQGENDETAGTATYADKWSNLLAALTSDGIITNETPIVLGELASKFTGMNAVLNGIASADARVGIAAISGYATSDTTHFAASVLDDIGTDYVDALSSLPDTPFTGV